MRSFSMHAIYFLPLWLVTLITVIDLRSSGGRRRELFFTYATDVCFLCILYKRIWLKLRFYIYINIFIDYLLWFPGERGKDFKDRGLGRHHSTGWNLSDPFGSGTADYLSLNNKKINKSDVERSQKDSWTNVKCDPNGTSRQLSFMADRQKMNFPVQPLSLSPLFFIYFSPCSNSELVLGNWILITKQQISNSSKNNRLPVCVHHNSLGRKTFLIFVQNVEPVLLLSHLFLCRVPLFSFPSGKNLFHNWVNYVNRRRECTASTWGLTVGGDSLNHSDEHLLKLKLNKTY